MTRKFLIDFYINLKLFKAEVARYLLFEDTCHSTPFVFLTDTFTGEIRALGHGCGRPSAKTSETDDEGEHAGHTNFLYRLLSTVELNSL